MRTMSSDIRIGMVSPDAPPHTGGMGRHVGSLVSGLSKEGAQVLVFSAAYRPMASLFGNVGFSLFLPAILRRWVRKNGITLLHLHTGPGGALLSRRLPEIPLVVTANHTYARQCLLPGQRWKRLLLPWERATYRAADSILCISEDTADSLRTDYGISEERIHVIHCGFDLTPYRSACRSAVKRQPLSCVFIGRPQTRKGWDLLYSSWPLIRKAVPDATLDVVGFHAEPIDGVRYHGRLSDEDVQRLLGTSRLLIAPSRLEGFGLAAAEAIACGTPVVSTDVGGLRRVVQDGVTGLLVPVSVPALVGRVTELLQNDTLWNTLHEGCLRTRDAFDLMREIEAHRKVYDALYSSPR